MIDSMRFVLLSFFHRAFCKSDMEFWLYLFLNKALLASQVISDFNIVNFRLMLT